MFVSQPQTEHKQFKLFELLECPVGRRRDIVKYVCLTRVIMVHSDHEVFKEGRLVNVCHPDK